MHLCSNSTLSLMAKHTILCVDDEIDNVEALERIFRSQYTVLKATSGKDALQILDHYPDKISIIITDQRMPEMTGIEFLEKTLNKHSDSVRILLTGYTDLESVIGAVNQGQIFRYLTKPWNPGELLHTVQQAISKYLLGQELINKNQLLANAVKELELLDEAKNNFMILINHELKTPLTSIINFVSLILETKLDDEQNLYADRIRIAADRLRSLIEDTLLLVRSELNQINVHMEKLSLANLFTELNPEISNLIEKKQVKLILQLENSNCLADRRLLQQAIDRILHNAVKFSPDGADVIVRSSVLKNKMLIEFYNHGTQINPLAISKLKQAFFTDENILNHSSGVGLGLTVSNVLLKHQNSDLKIENISEGVKVSFELDISQS